MNWAGVMALKANTVNYELEYYAAFDRHGKVLVSTTRYEEFCKVIGPKREARFRKIMHGIHPDREKPFIIKGIGKFRTKAAVKKEMVRAFFNALWNLEIECFRNDVIDRHGFDMVTVSEPEFNDDMLVFIDGQEAVEVRFKPKFSTDDRQNATVSITGNDSVERKFQSFFFQALELIEENEINIFQITKETLEKFQDLIVSNKKCHNKIADKPDLQKLDNS